MQNINDSKDEVEVADAFIRAEDLRNITLTPEQLFQIQKENLCNTLMESMVKVATKNGSHVYASNILEAMDERLRNELVEFFKELGYDVALSDKITTEQQTQNGVQKIEYRVLSIGWAPKVEAKVEESQQNEEA